MKIILVGANGKMGRAICEVAKANNLQIIAKIDKIGAEYTNFNNIPQNITKSADVVLDFAMPEVLDDELDFCIKNNKKLVICCTGHSPIQEEKLAQASKKIAIFKTANTSVGIALINRILNDYAHVFEDYQTAILEKHHKNKKDIPSGTAKKFIDILASKNIACDCHSIRAGSCAGEHQILLFNEHEQISICHTAESRILFALGAINICYFLKEQPRGFYDMENFLNFKLHI